MKVYIFKGSGWQPWRFRAVAGNGEIVAASQGYLTKWNAKRAARKVFPTAEIRTVGFGYKEGEHGTTA